MEAAGTGFDKISQEYENADEGHKPFIFSSSDHFTLVLPDLTFSEGVSDTARLPEVVFSKVANGTLYDRKILAFCYRREKSVAEIAALLGLSNSSYLRENVLGNLISQGFLIKTKKESFIYFQN